MNVWEQIVQSVLGTVESVVGVRNIARESIAVPPDPAMGDMAIPCFMFAKRLKKNPAEIARDWAGRLASANNAFIENVTATGPYVNITLNTRAVASVVLRGRKDIATNGTAGKGKKVMIEYSQPNTHKEFHAGHLRNVALGAALVALYRKEGYRVVAANYIGDVGAHVAKCLWALTKFHAKEKPPRGAEGAWLGTLYVEGSNKTVENEEYALESKEFLRRLEAGDEKLAALWKKTRAWSMAQFERIYTELGVRFDVWYFESEVEKSGKRVVAELLKKRIAKVSQGAVIVDLEKEGLGIFLVLRSDGTSLYSTKDLALAQKKFKRFALDESIHVVDNRQSQYFAQLFCTLQKLGFKKKMTHVPYEMVTTKEGTMSSRLGNVVRYETVRDDVLRRLMSETKKRHSNWGTGKTRKIAHAIMQGAIKFMMLRSDPQKIVTFDMEEALSFEGYTGPYVQYACARIHSVLRETRGTHAASIRVAAIRAAADALREPEEKRLLLQLARFWTAVREAHEQYNPAVLCRYLYETAKIFTDFYVKHKVLTKSAPERTARLALCAATVEVLEEGLRMLGIPALEQM